ncbi:hypothetical protein AC249_AIPGENE28966 [Exaiptasia diaphana]|nr:hypothetical protein AC249_AIPGENE28966 [Exaiptasia diaphana]
MSSTIAISFSFPFEENPIPFSEMKEKIPYIERNNLTCVNPQKYHRDEYTMSSNKTSAVIIKKTGEVLNPEDYYINETEKTNGSQAIYVCRNSFNCSNQWRLLDQGEFLVFKNGTIFVHASNRLYNKSEYILQNSTVLVCDKASLDIDSFVPKNCSGKWGLMESHEYTILTNRSIYVNASHTLYDLSQYMWQNQKIFVCFTDDPLAKLSTHDETLSFLTFVCMSISIIALVFVLVTYSLFTELRTPPEETCKRLKKLTFVDMT